MAIKVGIDIVKVSRIRESIRRRGRVFLERIFTPEEIRICSRKASRDLSYAARFAAKEAFFKALGGADKKLRYQDIEVQSLPSGAPALVLSSLMRKKLGLGRKSITVSLTHEKEFAVAVVIVS